MASFARGNPARWWKSRSCGIASRSPRALFISPLRRWSSAAALIFFILLVALAWYITNPARISRLSEVLLSRVLGGRVTVRTGHLSFSGTLLLSGVEVRTNDSEPTPSAAFPIFSAEQIEVRFDWISLLSGQLSATQLVATTPVFRPIEDQATGHWNYERLRPPAIGGVVPAATLPAGGSGEGGGGGGGRALLPRNFTLPVVVLQDARVKWGEVHQGRVEQTAETIINGQLIPEANGGAGGQNSAYRFQLSQIAPHSGQKGDASAAPAGSEVGAVVRGTWDVAANTFSATMNDVDMTDALKNGMPREARQWCEEHHLAGRLSQLSMTFNPIDGLQLAVSFDGVSMMFMIAPEQGIGVGEDRPSYPLDVRNVRGQLAFTFTPAAMHVRNLQGEVLGYPFNATCDVQGMSFDNPFTLNLRFPDAVLGDRYPPLFMAFLTSQDLMQRVEPHGHMDIAVSMRRSVTYGPMLVDGIVDCHDARMRFAHFPYPMEHINGRITFDQESVTFHDVTASADENDIHISGSTGTTWRNRMIDFTITSRNATFDDRMAACLPDQFKDVWDLFSVRAHGSFVCRVTRANSIFDQPRSVVDVDIDRGSGYIRSLPYIFSNAAGHLHFESDETRISHFTAVTGADGSGHVAIDGVVYHPSGDVTHLQPELKVKADIPIDVAFLHALPAELTSKLGGISLAGRLNFDGTIRRQLTDIAAMGSEKQIQLAGTIGWSHGSLVTRIGEEPVVLTGIAAQAAISPDFAVDLKNFSGNFQVPNSPESANQLALSGSGKLDPSFAGRFDLHVRAAGVALPDKLPGYIPDNWKAAWKDYSPSGKLDVAANAVIQIHAADAGAPVSLEQYDLALTPRDVALRHADWPDPLEKLRGSVTATPGQIVMTGMSAAMGNLALKWTGKIVPQSGAVSLAGEVASEGWPIKWLDRLPTSLRETLDTHPAKAPATGPATKPAEGVALRLQLDSLTRDSADAAWSYNGRLDTHNIALAAGSASHPFPILAQRADFVGKGTFDPAQIAAGKAFDFTGALAATNVSVSDHMLDTLTSSVTVSGADRQIAFDKLDGKVAGGRLQGVIRIFTPSDRALSAMPVATAPGTMPAQGGYTAELVLNDAELSRLVLPPSATDEDRKKASTGRVTASLTLQETFGAEGDRTGRGDLAVRDGDIYNVPLSMGLMQIVTLRIPVAHSFQQATMSYYLRNDEITFERISLESQGINLAGLGTVTINGHNMNLSFVTESPHELFIPIISPIINETRNELLQLSVTGPMDNPKITPVPLSAIANTLRAILPHSRADAGK